MEEETQEMLKKIARQVAEIANNVGEEYRKEAFAIILEFLLQLKKDELIQRAKTPLAIIPASRGIDLQRLTLVEFLKRVDVESNPERMVAIAYYMKYKENIEEFTLNDLLERWKIAGLKMPGNPRRDFKEAIKKAWISPTMEGKKYYITNDGITFIESRLGSEEST